MLNKFRAFCGKQKLFSGSDKILLAVSGGVDSMVMMHLMHQAAMDIGVAHCNFQLRGEESDSDELLVQNAAERLGIPYFSKRFKTKEYSRENAMSIQQSARKLRYNWFEEIRKSEAFDWVATAHHASDQTETMLYNITKGCGISGLRGIPIINSRIIRPLLFAARDQIVEYAEQNNIVWREDESNAENKYSRNLIRNSIISELKKINPGLDKTMLRNSERYRSIEGLIVEKKEEILSKYMRAHENDTTLSLEWLGKTKGGFILLEEILKDFGFNFDQVSSIYENQNQQSGKIYISEQFRLTVDRNEVQISPVMEEAAVDLAVDNFDEVIHLKGVELHFKKVLIEQFVLVKGNNYACVDLDLLKKPLKIRNWKNGDSFMPLGMKHKKKLSDFMIDQKIPLNLKKRVLLLESAGQIVWVIGYRIDDQFKVTSKTQNTLIIECKKC